MSFVSNAMPAEYWRMVFRRGANYFLSDRPAPVKTLTAAVLAGELGIPLLEVRLDGLITKFMGETAAKLRQVFDAVEQTRGICLFDEFDTIGSNRSPLKDVGEIRRVLNSFLLMIEQDQSHSLIVVATNQHGVLDSSLFRRFDDVLTLQSARPATNRETAQDAFVRRNTGTDSVGLSGHNRVRAKLC